jgi:hypothetical protein
MTHSAALFIAAPPVPVAVKQRDDAGEETGEKRICFRTASRSSTRISCSWAEPFRLRGGTVLPGE